MYYTATLTYSGQSVEILIELDPKVRPLQAQVCRVSVVKLNRATEELGRLSKRTSQYQWKLLPTDGLSNILVKEKLNEKLQICLESSQTINRAIRRPKHARFHF